MSERRQVVYLLTTACMIIGLLTGRAFFFNIAAMLVGVLIIALFWSWLAVRWISIYRKTRASRAQVGQQIEEVFSVRNISLIPKLWLEITDNSTLPQHNASRVIPALRPRGVFQWRVKTLCRSRGEFRLGPIQIVSGDPFGLFLVHRRIAAASRIVVYPAIVPLTHVELPIGVISGGEALRRRTHYITTNAAGVRDYAPGDSFNRIHWPSTARKGHLIVKEFEIDPLVDIWLFADFSQDSLMEADSVKRINGTGPVIPTVSEGIPQSTEEYTAVIVASLARYFIGLERTVGFAAYGPNREIHQPDRGSRQLSRILETLAVARSSSGYTLSQMLALETPYFTRGTMLVIVTASLDRQWVTEAQILNRRGIRPLCIFLDSRTFGGKRNPETIKGMLQVARIPTVVVECGDNIAQRLSQHMI